MLFVRYYHTPNDDFEDNLWKTPDGMQILFRADWDLTGAGVTRHWVFQHLHASEVTFLISMGEFEDDFPVSSVGNDIWYKYDRNYQQQSSEVCTDSIHCIGSNPPTMAPTQPTVGPTVTFNLNEADPKIYSYGISNMIFTFSCTQKASQVIQLASEILLHTQNIPFRCK